MKKIFYSLIILLLFSLVGLVGSASAQSLLQYPIPDLGYCRDAKECYLYCEIPEHKAACWSYGKYRVGSDVLGVTTMSEKEKQYMRDKAKEYGITFPIADLGGCAGPQECRDFCEQPANHQTCMDFAKKKGFHKEMERSDGMDPGKRDELLQQAKTELGCTSMESCSKVCENNQSRCEAFARKHGVYHEPPESRGRYSAEEKMQLMEKAKTDLGCASMDECRATCEKDPQRCMDFAKKHGFHKESGQSQQYQYRSGEYQEETAGRTSPNYGIQRFGKGGCDSEESCKKYCQEHPDECPGYRGYERASEGGLRDQQYQREPGSYAGPSGCRTEVECKNWCEAHPDKCPGFAEGKAREDAATRDYERRKHEMERDLETKKQQFEQQDNYQQYQYQQYQNYQPTPSYNPGSYTGTSGY